MILAAGTALALCGSAAGANAAVLDLTYPTGTGPGVYTQDGFTFTNSSGDSNAYGNWITFGRPEFNANGDNPTIFQNYGYTLNTISSVAPFSLFQIGLANVYNSGDFGQIAFTFNHVGGATTNASVNLTGAQGLHIFSFAEQNLTSVAFQAVSTQGGWLQYDLVGVNGSAGVPEPASWALLIAGFGMAGVMLRRRDQASRAAA